MKKSMNLRKRGVLSIPNLITGFRLLLIPLFVLAYFSREYVWALVCLALSGLSDVADGYIARRFDMVTELGKLLDPVADKLTQGSVLFCLAVWRPVLWILFGLLAVKELVMGLWGWVGLRRTGRMISSRWYGKVCTAVLYASMALLILAPGLSAGAVYAVIAVCGAVMLMSLTLYSGWYIRYLRQNKGGSHPVRNHMAASANISLVLSAMIVVVLLICAALAVVYRKEINLENIVRFTPENLWLAALVFMGLYAAKSLTSVVYVKLLYIAAGVIFPLPAAIGVGLAGTAVELIVPYLIGLGGGQQTAKLILERWPKLKRITEIRNRSNFWFSVLARASGVLPADPVSIYSGACRMPFGEFLLGSTAGLLPTLLIATVAGGALEDPDSPGFIAATILFAVVQAGSAAAFILWVRHHNKTAGEFPPAAELKGEQEA